ncbi:MAG: S1 RNA-binding domain-containing protein [Candidatus Micrarchaeota archaeon]
MANYPELGEFVIAHVTKIMPYGAFCTLEEYGSMEAFLHVSEVSSGWVKNIRDFVKEGQKIIALVSRLDPDKHQIDLSLKRVSESDRRKKLESFQLGKRAEKLLERAGIRLKKNLRDSMKEVGDLLIAEYGDLYSAFEKIKEGEVSKKIPPSWIGPLKEVAEAEIKEKVLTARVEMKISSMDSDGLEKVRAALLKIQKIHQGIRVHYTGAPNYYADFIVKDFKEVDKIVSKMEKALSDSPGIDFTIERSKG